MTKKEYLEQRNALATRGQEILAKADAEKRGLSPEERENYDKIASDIGSLDETQKRRDQQDSIEAEARTIAERNRPAPVSPKDPADPAARTTAELARSAHRNWIRGGVSAMSEDERQYVSQRLAALPPEVRALATGSGAAGGYTVEDERLQRIESAMKRFGGMMESSEIIATSTGADMPFPTADDTGNTGAQLDENTQIAQQDVTFGQIVLKSYTFTSKLILVPWQLLQDSAFDIERWLDEKLGERIGRIVNTRATTGTGVGTLRGIVVASTAGKTAASATAVTFLELLDLKHSVDPAYRMGAKWMFNDATLKALKQLVDGASRPIWQPGIASSFSGGYPDTIDGDRYVINQDMASMTTGQKTILYGDLSKYKLRIVKGVTLVALRERYADYLQTGLFGFYRCDGNLIDAGQHPVKHLVQA